MRHSNTNSALTTDEVCTTALGYTSRETGGCPHQVSAGRRAAREYLGPKEVTERLSRGCPSKAEINYAYFLRLERFVRVVPAPSARLCDLAAEMALSCLDVFANKQLLPQVSIPVAVSQVLLRWLSAPFMPQHPFEDRGAAGSVATTRWHLHPLCSKYDRPSDSTPL